MRIFKRTGYGFLLLLAAVWFAMPVAAAGPAGPTKGKNGETIYQYVYFGSYPQTEITGKALTKKIKNAVYSTKKRGEWERLVDEEARGDAVIDGVCYRADKLHTLSGMTGELHYFRYDPIRWRVLENDGKTLLLMSDKILDAQALHSCVVWAASTYDRYTIKAWLNSEYYEDKNESSLDYNHEGEGFLKTAFTAQEQKILIDNGLREVDDRDYYEETYGPGEVHKVNVGKVFLLSARDAINPAYGFSDKPFYDPARQLECTDYASSRYAQDDEQTIAEANEPAGWRLASQTYFNSAISGEKVYESLLVNPWGSFAGDYDGKISGYSYFATPYDNGIVPVIRIPIDSKGWSTKNPGVKKITVAKPSVKSVKLSGGKVTVKWSAAAGAARYELQYSTDSKFKKNVKTKKVSGTSVTFTKPKNGTYYFRVRGACTVLYSNVYGSYSSSKKLALGPKAGDTLKSGALTYKVTKADGSKREVAVTGGKKKAGLTIAGQVTIDGVKWKITAIADNAFAKNTKLKKITIGANVKSIGKKAFYQAGKLENITVKSKVLTKVGANALKGISKKAKITVPAAKWSAYKKLFRNKGQKSSVQLVK